MTAGVAADKHVPGSAFTDDDSESWVAALRAKGPEHDAAVARTPSPPA
jgi:hypothetical protein